MRANEYQAACYKFDNHVSEYNSPALVLGLVAEAGEVANEYERSYRKGGSLDEYKIVLELGDCLWNVARLADELGYTLEDIMRMNLDKLTARYAERGLPVKDVD